MATKAQVQERIDKMFEIIKESPGIKNKELASQMGISMSLVSIYKRKARLGW